MSGPAERCVAAVGRRIAYLEQGQGEPLVLLHGIGSASRSWMPQLDGLASSFRVVAWDAPGYGGSDPVDAEQPSAADYALALEQLLGALGAGRIHLVGHSLGTVIALAFAASRPERISTLTLASLSSGHARLPDAERARLREARLSDLATLGPKAMAEKRGPRLLGPKATPEQVSVVIDNMSRIRPAGYTQAVWMLSGADTRADLEQLPAGMPVQIVYGDADVVTTPESIRAVAAARPAAPHRVIAGAGHALYIEQPEAFNAIVRDFARQ